MNFFFVMLLNLLLCHMSGCSHCKHNQIMSSRYIVIVNKLKPYFPSALGAPFLFENANFLTCFGLHFTLTWSKTLLILIESAYIWKRSSIVFEYIQLRNRGFKNPGIIHIACACESAHITFGWSVFAWTTKTLQKRYRYVDGKRFFQVFLRFGIVIPFADRTSWGALTSGSSTFSI